jgi:hypothetical protein
MVHSNFNKMLELLKSNLKINMNKMMKDTIKNIEEILKMMKMKKTMYLLQELCISRNGEVDLSRMESGMKCILMNCMF